MRSFRMCLWPAWIPLAVMLMEAPGKRHRVLQTFVGAGAAVGAYLLLVPVAFPAVSRPIGQHIEYLSPHFFAAEVMTLYLLATTVSPLLSTHGAVKVFGALALLSFGAAYYFYTTWFISVWCFFAALLSGVVDLHFAMRERSRLIDNCLPAHRS
jgi:hypothetical protein